MTEPDAGSDAASLRTHAQLRGDRYSLSGTKHWITNGGVADVAIVFATVDPALGKNGITAFLVETNAHGLKRAPMPGIELGHRGSDHVGGAASLIARSPVRSLSSSLEATHPLRASSVPHTRCEAGQHWTWDGVRFTVLYPRAEDYDRSDLKPNAMSCVLRVTDAAGRSLLDPRATQKVLERLRSGAQSDSKVDQLNDQERRILVLIGEGMTNRQIGENMHLAEKTVKNYVSNLLMKMGMQRRTEAAVYKLLSRLRTALNDCVKARLDSSTA